MLFPQVTDWLTEWRLADTTIYIESIYSSRNTHVCKFPSDCYHCLNRFVGGDKRFLINVNRIPSGSWSWPRKVNLQLIKTLGFNDVMRRAYHNAYGKLIFVSTKNITVTFQLAKREQKYKKFIFQNSATKRWKRWVWFVVGKGKDWEVVRLRHLIASVLFRPPEK